MTRRAVLPNPSRPRQLRPAALITDRAKRYRAQNAVQGPRRCIYCGAPGHATRPMMVDHIDGREANGAPANLAYSCRSCNGAKSYVFKLAGIGKRTAQFNPHKPTGGVKSLAQWVWASSTVRIPKKEGRPRVKGDEVHRAAILISDTPFSRRAEFARRVWEAREAHGTAREEVPF